MIAAEVTIKIRIENLISWEDLDNWHGEGESGISLEEYVEMFLEENSIIDFIESDNYELVQTKEL